MDLRMNKIHFKYRGADSYTIKDISFEIKSGSLVAIVGESGSGKSTTLRVLAGLERPEMGEIRVGNQVFYDAKTDLLPEQRKLGMVFQDYALFPHLTVEKNIGFGLGKISKKEKQNQVKKMLELVDLEGLEKRYPHELSGGQQQRVALARALAPAPKILLLDEPFSNLDAHLHDKIRKELTAIIRKIGTTTIFVTHDQRDAHESADHVIVMADGKIVKQGLPKEIL